MESPTKLEGALPVVASSKVNVPLEVSPDSCSFQLKDPSTAEVKDRVLVSFKLVVSVPEFPSGLHV